MHITHAFLDGMNKVAENKIKTIHVIDKHIEYCNGCFACMRNGGDCIHHDDMRGRNFRKQMIGTIWFSSAENKPCAI